MMTLAFFSLVAIATLLGVFLSMLGGPILEEESAKISPPFEESWDLETIISA